METLKLKTLYLELTHACNQKCKHCYLDGGIHHKIEEMSTEAIKKMIREFKEQGGYSIIITGGEPLVRKDCFEILDYIEALDIAFTFASNSLLMNKKRLERLASYKNLKQYFTSILGSNKEKHNTIAGNNSYDKVYEALKFFDKNRIATYVQVTLVKDYIEDMEAIAITLMKLRYCTVKITPVASLGSKEVEDTISDFIVEQKYFISFQEKIMQLQDQYLGRIEDANIMSKSQIEAYLQGYKDHPLYSLSYGFLAIRPDGTKSFSCNMNNPYVFGNAMNGLEIKLEEHIYKYINVLREAEYHAQEKANDNMVEFDVTVDTYIQRRFNSLS